MDKHPVLVIDDDADSLLVVQTLLKEAMGVASLPAKDAMEALMVINRVRPKLILLDMCMPGPNSSYDGLMVARQVKSNPATRHIPVVAVSALRTVKELAREAGCDDFIEKPFDVDTFVGVVEKHLPANDGGDREPTSDAGPRRSVE